MDDLGDKILRFLMMSMIYFAFFFGWRAPTRPARGEECFEKLREKSAVKTTQPVSAVRAARCASNPPQTHGVGCACCVHRIKLHLFFHKNPGPGAVSLIKHTCVHAFWNL